MYYEFLCACLRLDGREAKTLLQDPDWNWEHLFQTANGQAVLPALSHLMPTLGLTPFVPADVLDFLSAVEFLNQERNEGILREVETAARLLNQAGIQPVLLKGAAYLAMGVYQNSAARYVLDADLLVSEKEIEASAEILMRNGFERDDRDQFGRFRHHHPPLQRPGSVAIELHHSLGLGICAVFPPVREVIEQSVLLDFRGVTVRVPRPEHMMTHLIVHSQMQHPYNERIWPPLRAMYDLVMLKSRLGASLNWSHIDRGFRNIGQQGVLALHLLQVRDALGMELPFSVRLTMFTRVRWLRRRLLRQVPTLRYFDPIYMFSTVCIRRLRVLRSVLSTREGWKHLATQLLSPSIYHRFLIDVVQGRGR